MRFKHIIFTILCGTLMLSCAAPKNITYFQDLDYQQSYNTPQSNKITVKSGDKISIIVNSKDARLADMFNLPYTTSRIGANSNASSLGTSQQISCYSVDNDGKIDFPTLGKISVEGKTREAIAEDIKTRLISEQYIADPVVTVEFANLYFSVIGEVGNPGRYNIEHDKVTLLDAISMAGDLTINGQRENIIVLREENGSQKAYMVNLTSAQELYNSPVFYLQQKDVIYVEPNSTRKRQSTINGNNTHSAQFWVSIGTSVTSIASTIITLTTLLRKDSSK